MTNILLILFLSIILSFSSGCLFMWLYLRSSNSKQATTPAEYTASGMGSSIIMPEEVKNQLLNETKHEFEEALDKSAEQFSHDLTTTSDKVNTQIKDLSATVIANELEEYRNGLVKLREQALSGMGSVQEAIEKQRQTMEADLEKEIQAEKARRLAQIDTKLGDAVSTFLLEVLQHNIDLGAQSPYLLSILEEHKEELKQEVNHDV
jgi:hypothetical protein